MPELASFRPDASAAIIGASGGIGSSFCQMLAENPAFGKVHALSRTKTPLDLPGVRPAVINILDEESVADSAKAVAQHGELDLVIVATGVLHKENLQPEKSLRNIDGTNMLEVLKVNTVGPTIVAKHFLPLMRRSGKTVFAVLSARVGSIADNRLGGWISYRSSKAALNMAIKTLSIEHARKFPDGVVVSLHPGTVATELSAPFRSRTPAAELFDPDTSATHLLRVIDGLQSSDTGGFRAWDGTTIES